MKVKKKVCIVSYGLDIGGIERSLIGLLDAFDYENFAVDLFLFSHNGEFMSLINKNIRLLPEIEICSLIKSPIIEIFKKRYFKLGLIRLWAKVVAKARKVLINNEGNSMMRSYRLSNSLFPKLEKQYDLALGFFGPHDFLIKNVKAKTKVGWVHTDYSKLSIEKEYEIKQWEKLDYIAAVSEECKAIFETGFPMLANKLIVIENILDSHFVCKQADELYVDQEMPRDGSIRICTVGRFCEAKALDLGIIACRKLIDANYNIKWYVVGYGPDENLLRQMISKYEVDSSFIILGKKTNPYPYIKACEIYVQPSRYEGKAVTVREAQMLGKPVMITNFATSKSQLIDGVDGYICPLGVNGVVEGLKYLIEHPLVRESLSTNTLQRNYNNDSEIEKIYALC